LENVLANSDTLTERSGSGLFVDYGDVKGPKDAMLKIKEILLLRRIRVKRILS
jgi:hypothetical protein